MADEIIREDGQTGKAKPVSQAEADSLRAYCGVNGVSLGAVARAYPGGRVSRAWISRLLLGRVACSPEVRGKLYTAVCAAVDHVRCDGEERTDG